MVQVNEQRINVRFVVKLNNPQMGTETSIRLMMSRLRSISLLVKLNNPLMGTEAEFLSVFLLIKKC